MISSFKTAGRAVVLALGLLRIGVLFAEEPVYTVKAGDTLWRIAKAQGLDFGELCKANGKAQDWSLIRPGEKIVVGELLDESGDVSLFAWKTASDVAFNKSNDWLSRNSLFMRRRTGAGTNEWQLVMTSGGDSKPAGGMNERSEITAFYVLKASLSKDGKFIWMVCNPHTATYNMVCSLELATKTIRELIDGDSVNEQADGTLFVTGKKTYLSDEKGEPLGAAWYDLWITPEGKVVRKTRPITMAEMEEQWAKEEGRHK